MIQRIKDALTPMNVRNANHGCFVTVFDQAGAVLASNGSVETTRTVGNFIETLHNAILHSLPDPKLVMVDIVTSMTELANGVADLASVDLTQYGVCLIGDAGQKTGCVLPNTAGVSGADHALFVIQQKYAIATVERVFVFSTQRVPVSL